MNTKPPHTEKLFSYGTLRYEAVQLETFGRKLSGRPDTLCAYKIALLKISNPDVVRKSGEALHPVLSYTANENDRVEGIVFNVSKEELEKADEYEEADYKRIAVRLKSGIDAWVYVAARE